MLNETETHLGNVLIVDDTPLNLRLLSEMLVRQGYSVDIARNGAEAIQAVQINVPEVILLDIKMPEMDGYEVCRQLKAQEITQDIPVIFISALNDIEDIIQGFEAGGVDYVTKPFKFREVLARIENQLMLARQRRQIETMRQREIEHFTTLDNMKNRFIHMATHDLKNPLALMMGHLGLLRERPAVENDEEAQTHIEGISIGISKMRNLVTDMLDLAQIKSGIELHFTHVPMSEFLQQCVKSFALQAIEKDITLTFCPPLQDFTVRIDAEHMDRAITNLISNAIKYTPNGGHVQVSAGQHTGSNYIEVKDTGYGIPEADLPHLFDEFYRVRDKRHIQSEGTGLGLAIVKSVAEQHQGQVEIETCVGQGTTFRIVFP